MSTSIETAAAEGYTRAAKVAKPKKKITYLLLVAAWLVLISGGVTGAKLYTDHVRETIAAQIAQQTDQQLQVVQEDYQKQVAELKLSIGTDMTNLQAKVDSLNELLAFTKDSANDKTDNSNQLYTQLADVKKKLDELQKNLDVLK